MGAHRWQSRLSPVYTTMFFLAVSYLVRVGARVRVRARVKG